MNYKPLSDYVQIRIEPKTSKTGIILSEEPSETAKVIAVGPDVKEVSVGDEVFYSKFAGVMLETKFDRILQEKDILAKVVN